MKKLLNFIVMLCVVASLSGCLGTKTERLMDWTNLHRIGPNTTAQVYYWDETAKTWYLTDDKYTIPEGHFVGPPPSVDDIK